MGRRPGPARLTRPTRNNCCGKPTTPAQSSAKARRDKVKPLRPPASAAQLARLADVRFEETPRAIGAGNGVRDYWSCLKGAVRGVYGAKAAGSLWVFNEPEARPTDLAAPGSGRRTCLVHQSREP